jgi:hypothetical protein
VENLAKYVNLQEIGTFLIIISVTNYQFRTFRPGFDWGSGSVVGDLLLSRVTGNQQDIVSQ